MEVDRQIKCVTCFGLIDVFEQEYYEYIGKKICVACFESITGGNNMKTPSISTPQECQIPKIPDLHNNIKETCNSHQKTYKFYCDYCLVCLCVSCLPTHSTHGYSDILSKAKSLLSDLHTLEHLTRYTLAILEGNQSSLETLLESILNSHNLVNSRSASSIISFLSIQNKDLFAQLINFNPDFLGLTLPECQVLIKDGRDLMKEPKTLNWTHWCEWNERSLHLLNLNTMRKTTVLLNQTLPFYCRSASLPYNQVFVCGGRVANNTQGLKSAFLIHLNEDSRIEKLNDMEVGRSNHCVIYFKGYVYVLAGCNELNQYTNKCERLKIPELKWEKITPCPDCVDTASVAALEESNFLFLSGGRNSSTALSTEIQKYNILENSWINLSIKLPYETSVHGSIFVSNKELLILAGQDKNADPISKAFIINIESGELNNLSVMSKGGCIVNECLNFGGKIFFLIFQGFCSRILETFTINSQEWKLEDLN